jgi:hypothetical protein
VGFGCGWAKLNVVFLCRQVRWQNTSFNFAKRWHFSFLYRFAPNQNNCFHCFAVDLKLHYNGSAAWRSGG